MENTLELNAKARTEVKKADPHYEQPVRRIRNASVNLIRQFPERPGEWGNRIVVVVLAGNNAAEA